jgi:hypothetical protein
MRPPKIESIQTLIRKEGERSPETSYGALQEIASQLYDIQCQDYDEYRTRIVNHVYEMSESKMRSMLMDILTGIGCPDPIAREYGFIEEGNR